LADLEKNEVVLYVPNKCIISTEHARLSALGPVYDASPELFVMNQDRDICMLIVFIIYERLKGADSFYKPYLDVVDSPTPTCYWSGDLLQQSDFKEFRLNI